MNLPLKRRLASSAGTGSFCFFMSLITSATKDRTPRSAVSGADASQLRLGNSASRPRTVNPSTGCRVRRGRLCCVRRTARRAVPTRGRDRFVLYSEGGSPEVMSGLGIGLNSFRDVFTHTGVMKFRYRPNRSWARGCPAPHPILTLTRFSH